MDAGMDMTFPGGKANWRCDRVGIHCGTHPVGMTDGRQSKRHQPPVQAGLERIEETDDAAPCEIGRLGIVIGQAGVSIEVACARIGEDVGRDL
jgi:hypothetical protein